MEADCEEGPGDSGVDGFVTTHVCQNPSNHTCKTVNFTVYKLYFKKSDF